MNMRRILLGSLLAIAAALPLAAPRSTDARVVVGVGLGFPVFGYPYSYYPPPPVVYAPSPAYYGAPVVARCVTVGVVCPLRYARPVGAACGCPDMYGRYVGGRVG